MSRNAVLGLLHRRGELGEKKLADKPVERVTPRVTARAARLAASEARKLALAEDMRLRREERENKRTLGHLSSVRMERLAEKVVLPGIDKHLVPLALFKGTRSLGWVQRWWNFSLAAMDHGCVDLTDIVKLSHNPEFSHLCENTSAVQSTSLYGFMSRLRLRPEVTNNIPHMTEWVETLFPIPFQLRPVSLESFRRNCAPWRIYKPRRPATTSNLRASSAATGAACYPFIAHDPRRSTGADLVSKVNRAVPRGLPEEIRADICQDVICAILSGEMSEADLGGRVRDFIAAGRKMFTNKWEFVQLDAPMPGMDGKTFMDTLEGDINTEWEIDGGWSEDTA